MYNSTNLPLDRRKIIKKSLENGVWPTVGLLCGLAMAAFGLLTEGGVIFYIFGILCLILPLIAVYVYQLYYYKLYFYNFGNVSVEIRKGVISRSTGHVQYERIQNIYIDQDVLDRFFGLYDIHYETAGEASGIYSHIDGLNKENGEKLVEFLNLRLRSGKNFQLSSLETETTGITPSVGSKTTIAKPGEVLNSKIILLNKKYLFTALFSKNFFMVIGYAVAVLLTIVVQENVEITSIIKYTPYGLIVFLTFFIFFYIYNWVWFRNFYFEFNDTSGVIKTKVLDQSQTYIYYDRVQNINIHQGFLERILGISQIVIETAAGNGRSSRLTIPGLAYSEAEKVKDFLLQKVQFFGSNSRQGL